MLYVWIVKYLLSGMHIGPSFFPPPRSPRSVKSVGLGQRSTQVPRGDLGCERHTRAPAVWAVYVSHERYPVWIGFHRELPSGYVNIAIENDHRNSGFSHWKWWFSIVFCMFTRGYTAEFLGDYDNPYIGKPCSSNLYIQWNVTGVLFNGSIVSSVKPCQMLFMVKTC